MVGGRLVGEQRERYPSATALQQYAGIAPVTERSGKKSWVHWRLQCPKCSELITSAALLDYIAAFDWDSVRIARPSC